MRVRVVSAHVSSYPDPIELVPGDSVELGRRDDEYVGWIRVTTKDGNVGWAPEQFLEVISESKAVAKCAYSARELTTEVGDSLVVHSETNGWYWVETSEGDFGWVPKEAVA